MIVRLASVSGGTIEQAGLALRRATLGGRRCRLGCVGDLAVVSSLRVSDCGSRLGLGELGVDLVGDDREGLDARLHSVAVRRRFEELILGLAQPLA